MTREPKYYRARIEAIKGMLTNADEQTKRWLQNGFVPDAKKGEFDSLVVSETSRDNSPLSLVELTTFSTWFDMHPEKVAGTMQGGTSLYFPVIVKGTKADVEKMFANTLATPTKLPTAAELSEDEEMEMLELEAEALQLAIKLKLALLDDEPKTHTYEVGDIVYVAQNRNNAYLAEHKLLALLTKYGEKDCEVFYITPKGDGSYCIYIANKHWPNKKNLSPVDKALQAKIRQSIGEDEIDYFIQQSKSNN